MHSLALAVYCISIHTVASDGDYTAVNGEIVQFNEGDVTQTHTIVINRDLECENDTSKTFFSSISLHSGVPVINVTESLTTVFIDQVGCGKGAILYHGVIILPMHKVGCSHAELHQRVENMYLSKISHLQKRP